jgi:hypothetical protein
MSKKMMREDDDVENMGIMQGFMDSMAEDDDENEGDDEGDPEAMMERRPNSPEILMNNLRGDMRSVSARRDELADLVGYQAATETPDSVLAMLQPVLAQQGGGGIGALPQSQDMAQGPQPPMMGGAPGMPPPGMPPMPPDAGMPPPPQQGGIAELMTSMGGGMPPPPQQGGMPPSDQPPIAMARGGYVQNFRAGSDENGVTPAEGSAVPEDLMMYPPDMVAAARKSSMDLFNQRAAPTPTLSGAMAARLPEYTKLLGADRGASEAQMLFDLGQRAFGFAANVDDSGRPLRGSFMSRLAGATRTLPAAMGKRIDEISKIDRQLKVLALQQGEKDIDQITAQNAELQKRKGSLINEVLRAQAKVDAKKAGTKDTGPLGKGTKGDILNTLIQYAPLYAAGSLEPEQRNAFMTAVTDYTQPTQVEFTDPRTGLKSLRTQRNELPDFVREALGGKAPRSSTTTSSITTPSITAPPSSAGGAPAPTSAFLGLTPNNTNPETYQAASTAPKTTFFDFAGTGTGFVPVMVAGVARNVPVDAVGKIGPEFQQSTAMLTSMSNRIVNALQENPRFAETERAMIKKELDIEPRLLSNKNAYINQIIALDNVLEGIENKTYRVLNEPRTGITAGNEAAKKLEEIGAVREMLGIQQRTFLPTAPNYNSDEDRRKWAALPPGQYIVLNPQGFKEVREKKPAAKR